MSDSTTPVIVAAVRTPIGRYLGGLASFTAPQLGAMVIRDAIRRAGIEPSAVDEVFMGQVVQGGSGQAPARQALIGAGVPGTMSAITINKVCGSGLRAVMLAAQAIRAGDGSAWWPADRSRCRARRTMSTACGSGIKAGNQTMVDGMIHDGLWDSFGGNHMGEYAEYTAEKAGVTPAGTGRVRRREPSQGGGGQEAGTLQGGDSAGRDPRERRPDHRRRGTRRRGRTPRRRRSRASSRPSGRTVAPYRRERARTERRRECAGGDAPGLRHGARPDAAGARHAYATGGGEPKDLFFAPIVAVKNLMAKAGSSIGDYDLIEANEAFAVQALANGRALGWDWDRVNVNGGAVALGHPIGASGARVLTTLLYALQDHDATTGLATLCLGGGNAVALSVERMS